MKRIKVLMMLLVFWLTAPHVFAQQAVNVQDSLALVNLYDSTNGPDWENNSGWKSGPVSTWYGVTVAGGRLTELNLEFNNLSGALPASFGNLKHLHRLSLNGNELNSLPKSIGKLTNLQYLALDGNPLSSLPASFGNLTNLQYLGFEYAPLNSLPQSFGNLASLQTLDLEGNHLTSLPSSFGNLKHLQYLSLNNNLLSSLPASFGNLTNLQTLSLEGNYLSTLPASFGNLSKLSDLSLGGNQFSSLPASISNFINLQRLDLSGNQLNSLPESFGNLTHLQTLSLYYNQLSSLPASFGNLINLKSLDLEYNNFSSLPELITNFIDLQYLALESNQLTALPESFGNLINLQYLDLGRNQFSSLPKSFGNLTNLQTLSLENNQFTALLESFGNLSKLFNLSLGGNQLSSLPESFGKLIKLQFLNLSGNLLSSLPGSFGNIRELQDLYLSNNQFTFATLEGVVQRFSFAVYAPQDSFELVKSGNVLIAPVGGTPKNNTFSWYRDGQLETTIKADSTYTPTNAGRYRVEAHNAALTDLVLYSKVIDIVAWYRDADEDGYGNLKVKTLAATRPEGYVTDSTDCNDRDRDIHPGGYEVCDGKDNDCNGKIDDGNACHTITVTCPSGDTTVFATPGTCTAMLSFKAPVIHGDNGSLDFGYSLTGATEGGNTGNIDEVAFNVGVTTVTYFASDDQDNEGACTFKVTVKAGPEICGNGIDDNCNGQVDEGCPATPLLTINDTTVYESEGVTILTVKLSRIEDHPVYVPYFTVDGTARSFFWFCKDYRAAWGVLTIPAGVQTATISITIYSDGVREPDEYFDVYIFNSLYLETGYTKGRVTIKDGVPVLAPSITRIQAKEQSAGTLQIQAYPNPSTSSFTLVLQSLNNSTVALRINDAAGRTIETRAGVAPNTTLQLGSNYTTGIYFLETKQGKQRVILKLLKHCQ